MPEAVRKLLPRLRDARFTRVLLVALPEPTPIHEAAQLQKDLERAGIAPFAWVVNQSFAACGVTDPLLRQRSVRELPYIATVRNELSRPFALVPWQSRNLSAATNFSRSRVKQADVLFEYSFDFGCDSTMVEL
jgi:arsenite-transporting ATPase